MYIYRLRQSTTAINPTRRSSPRRTFLLIPLALALIGGVLERSANAAFPGNNGKIAFQSFRDGNVAIFTVNPDGSELTKLTSGLADDEVPSWSPDGSKIVFVSDRDGNFEVYSMNAEGNAQTRLTNNASDDEFPTWSPDGSKIVFVTDRDGNFEVYSMNVDGSSQTRLTSNSATEVAPAWSPDGTKIAFDSDRDGNREIYTIDSDGSNPVRLTSNAATDSDPNWSPDGTALAFVSNRNGNFEIDSMNADGSNVTNLTRNTAFDADPAWSPDGSMITFTTNRNGLNEIAVMNADGSGQTVISTGPDGFPDWQPIGLTAPTLLNISTRMRVLTGDQVLLGGFMITGTDLKRVLIRGIGPSLNGVGVTLSDPTLELHQGSMTLTTNDNWKTRPDGTSQQADIEATTIPPTNDSESSIQATLSPGAYTAILAGKNGVAGVGLVEVYDLAQVANSKLANISTRGFVDTDDNVMIGGFILGAGSADVIVRAIGPSLTSFGVEGALQDPALELHDANGVLIQSNDNWRSDQETEIIATTMPPSNDSESAIVLTLTSGAYTAIVRGRDDTTGVGLVEIYQIN